MTESPRRFLGVLGLGLAVLAALGLAAGIRQRLQPVKVAVGVDRPLVYGAAVDPTDLNTAQHFLEQTQDSPIQLATMFNHADPRQGRNDLQAVRDQGIRFIINTQTSSHLVPTLDLYDDGQVLAINVSATSTKLSGRDDYLLRIVPDLAREQRAIAARINQLDGSRLLVMRDTRNHRYTEPALEEFLKALRTGRSWQTTVREFRADRFDPRREQEVVNGSYDVLYILCGDFLPTMGNLAQQFHLANPTAPILLTPWGHSRAILENAGEARRQILIASPYPDRSSNVAVDRFLKAHQQRFGYQPYAMGLGTRQAMELLDQAFRLGLRTPAAVKRHLLQNQPHQTSLGAIRFTPSGDVEGTYHFLRP
jgi:branched-chain amino acid transport system substrate-binding protein